MLENSVYKKTKNSIYTQQIGRLKRWRFVALTARGLNPKSFIFHGLK